MFSQLTTGDALTYRTVKFRSRRRLHGTFDSQLAPLVQQRHADALSGDIEERAFLSDLSTFVQGFGTEECLLTRLSARDDPHHPHGVDSLQLCTFMTARCLACQGAHGVVGCPNKLTYTNGCGICYTCRFPVQLQDHSNLCHSSLKDRLLPVVWFAWRNETLKNRLTPHVSELRDLATDEEFANWLSSTSGQGHGLTNAVRFFYIALQITSNAGPHAHLDLVDPFSTGVPLAHVPYSPAPTSPAADSLGAPVVTAGSGVRQGAGVTDATQMMSVPHANAGELVASVTGPATAVHSGGQSPRRVPQVRQPHYIHYTALHY